LNLPQKAETQRDGSVLWKHWEWIADVKAHQYQSRQYVRGAIVLPVGVTIPGYVLAAGQSLINKELMVYYEHEFWQVAPAPPDENQRRDGAQPDIGLVHALNNFANQIKCLTYFIIENKYSYNRFIQDIGRQKLLTTRPVVINVKGQDDEDLENTIVKWAAAGKLKIPRESKLMQQLKNRTNSNRDNAAECLKTLLSGYEKFPFHKVETITLI